MSGTLIRVEAPGFVAGFIIEGGRVVRCAHILRRWVLGKSEGELRALFQRKGWRASRLGPPA